MVTVSPRSRPASAASTISSADMTICAGQLMDRQAGDVPELGRGRARQHGLNAHALVGELVLQRLRQRQHERFQPP